MKDLIKYIKNNFGVDTTIFLNALKTSPSAQGYTYGAISEVLLKDYLEKKGFEVIRIKEKPGGGNTAKSAEARGDFYIRKRGSKEDKWLVIESKGLKSNSEFRGSKLDSKDKMFKFLKSRAFPPKNLKKRVYRKGYNTYLKTKKDWEKKNKGKKFPPFTWSKNIPGPEACNLKDIWKNENDLKLWINSFDESAFSEESYRKVKGPVAILETHSPINRVGAITGIKHAAPLVADFNIMSVDLFLRTNKHEFVFMCSEVISHSPTSPEHQYQNYIIDILARGKKDKVVINEPWYNNVDECIKKTKPTLRKIDRTQIDNR